MTVKYGLVALVFLFNLQLAVASDDSRCDEGYVYHAKYNECKLELTFTEDGCREKGGVVNEKKQCSLDQYDTKCPAGSAQNFHDRGCIPMDEANSCTSMGEYEKEVISPNRKSNPDIIFLSTNAVAVSEKKSKICEEQDTIVMCSKSVLCKAGDVLAGQEFSSDNVVKVTCLSDKAGNCPSLEECAADEDIVDFNLQDLTPAPMPRFESDSKSKFKTLESGAILE